MLRFSRFARGQQIGVRFRGMNLDREHFVRIEELQKQWESVETPGQLPQHLLGKLIEQLTDGPTFEWSTGNVALMINAIAQ